MAVSNSIVKTQYPKVDKQILVDESTAITLGVVLANTGVSADTEGKKILKAGTPIYGDITARNTAFVKATESGDSNNAVAVLLHDVDVTDGDNNGTMVLLGCIDLNKLESDVQTLITAAAKTALRNVIFIK